jgi:dTDP-4-dehydrorhamnose reductase
MRYIIIGSSGKIGKYFLKKKNIIFTYNKKKLTNGIKFNLLKDDFQKILRKNNFSRAVILSAHSDPDFCKKYLKKTRLINVIKTKKLINTLIKNNIYFIFFSTEFVFDGKNGNYKEDDFTKPINVYGKQKLEIEKYIQKKTQNYCIFRIAKTYGDEPWDDSLINDFLKRSKNKIITFAAYDQIFSPIYVRDLVKITEFFIRKKIKGIYNVGGNKAISRYKLYKKFNFLLKNNKIYPQVKIVKKKIRHFKFFDKRPNNVSFNTKKLKKTLNFKLSNIEEIFNNVVK